MHSLTPQPLGADTPITAALVDLFDDFPVPTSSGTGLSDSLLLSPLSTNRPSSNMLDPGESRPSMNPAVASQAITIHTETPREAEKTSESTDNNAGTSGELNQSTAPRRSERIVNHPKVVFPSGGLASKRPRKQKQQAVDLTGTDVCFVYIIRAQESKQHIQELYENNLKPSEPRPARDTVGKTITVYDKDTPIWNYTFHSFAHEACEILYFTGPL